MQREIILKSGKQAELKKAMNVSYPTIRKALRFQTDTNTAKRIRWNAVKHFGGVEKNEAPEVDTTHDADNIMTQIFNERVKLQADKTTGKVGVYLDGELKATYRVLSISQLMKLQEELLIIN